MSVIKPRINVIYTATAPKVKVDDVHYAQIKKGITSKQILDIANDERYISVALKEPVDDDVYPASMDGSDDTVGYATMSVEDANAWLGGKAPDGFTIAEVAKSELISVLVNSYYVD